MNTTDRTPISIHHYRGKLFNTDRFSHKVIFEEESEKWFVCCSEKAGIELGIFGFAFASIELAPENRLGNLDEDTVDYSVRVREVIEAHRRGTLREETATFCLNALLNEGDISYHLHLETDL